VYEEKSEKGQGSEGERERRREQKNRQRKVDRISFAVMLACQKRTTMTTSGAETRAATPTPWATTRLSGFSTSTPYGNHLPAHYKKEQPRRKYCSVTGINELDIPSLFASTNDAFQFTDYYLS